MGVGGMGRKVHAYSLNLSTTHLRSRCVCTPLGNAYIFSWWRMMKSGTSVDLAHEDRRRMLKGSAEERRMTSAGSRGTADQGKSPNCARKMRVKMCTLAMPPFLDKMPSFCALALNWMESPEPSEPNMSQRWCWDHRGNRERCSKSHYSAAAIEGISGTHRRLESAYQATGRKISAVQLSQCLIWASQSNDALIGIRSRNVQSRAG